MKLFVGVTAGLVAMSKLSIPVEAQEFVDVLNCDPDELEEVEDCLKDVEEELEDDIDDFEFDFLNFDDSLDELCLIAQDAIKDAIKCALICDDLEDLDCAANADVLLKDVVVQSGQNLCNYDPVTECETATQALQQELQLEDNEASLAKATLSVVVPTILATSAMNLL